MSDRFLGEWNVQEFVYSPNADCLGTVEQTRRLFAEPGSEALLVEQTCRPSPSLREHPMGQFSGDFRFRLEKDGRERFYLGPDVQGFGTAFGGDYLIGEGVWPRFGFNFRSWSIRLSETRQLTGGIFFRGPAVQAIIFGIGQLKGSTAHAVPPMLDFRVHGGSGVSIELHSRNSEEITQNLHRHVMGSEGWREKRTDGDETFRMEPKGSDAILRRNNTVGMAKAFGPLLYWETHGIQGDSTQGLEVNDPFSQQQFALRQHFQRGRRVRIEGLQFRE